jgi:hypothetical protein
LTSSSLLSALRWAWNITLTSSPQWSNMCWIETFWNETVESATGLIDTPGSLRYV